MLALKSRPDTKKAQQQKLLSTIRPTGTECYFQEDELIVSKTDPKGRITYANDVFLKIARMNEAAALGAPHSVIRHPDMPRAVFKLLWDTLGQGKEVFAYVKNLAANGDHYWVLAHVTPSYDHSGTLVGYHSNRRVPERAAITTISGLYAQLLDIENGVGSRKLGMEKSVAALFGILEEKGISYDEFIFSL
jgi:PAS domain S-box-containing protein